MESPIFKNRINKEHKVEDGKRSVWESRSVAVNAVIFGLNSDNIFVMIEKRSWSMMDAPGKYCLPCGYMDWDEDGYEALTREVYEETSFYIPKYKMYLIEDNEEEPFFVNTKPTQNRQNIVLNYAIVYDFSKGLPKEIESYTDHEIEGIRWVPIEQLSKIDFAFDHASVIEKAIKKFRNVLEA